jgi:serine/threonine-protein kinase
MTGKKLAQYSIESSLGAGGMGEVYRAKDTRLGRDVAVKVLPEIFARDPERIARLQREAKVLASLNHPNIAVLYGLEEFEGTHFLVMELVEGETLAERVARGPLPAEEAIRVALQIAEAFEAAHGKEVVHRDLKTANVKITPEGKVKVLDFGLAKAMDAAPANANLSSLPTASFAGTSPGVILGTAAYMSPEQANGFDTDFRSDIFSFGCVLYEILTGRQAFQGRTVSEIMASVLAREPDMRLLPAKLNPRIGHLLRRCLQKEARNRWQAVGDVRVELEAALADPGGALAETNAATAPRPFWKRAVVASLWTLVGAAIAATAAWNLKAPSPAIVTKFPFTLPEGQQFPNTSRKLVAISPDGTQFVYVANQRLYLKPMRELQSIYIQGTESTQGDLNPVFSPDGRSIAFFSFSDQTLKRVAVSGGAPVTICQADPPFGMSWGPNDEIVFGQGAKGIMRVSANGGKPETIVMVTSTEMAHGPQILPGGGAVLFTLAASSGADMWDKASIVVQTLGAGERKTLIEGGRDARYAPTGHIIYALAGTLLAVPFDAGRLEVLGGPVSIVEGVRNAGGGTGSAHFSFSDTGSLVYVPGAASSVSRFQLALVDRSGSVKQLALPPGPYSNPRISPNGKFIAFGTDDRKEAAVWVYDLSGASSMRRVTFGGANRNPLWSGDGELILFMSDREGDQAIFWQRADGAGVAERVTKPEQGTIETPESWAAQLQRFSFRKRRVVESDVWTYSLDEKKAVATIAGPENQANSAFSPDGRWLAYQSSETGRFEIYVQPFPLTGAKFQITRDGDGQRPVWSPDGKELFFVNRGSLAAVTIRTEPGFTFGNPTPLPITGFIHNEQGNPQRAFDIAPDGKQFIMLFPADQPNTGTTSAPQIQVVLNWFEELKQRVAGQ